MARTDQTKPITISIVIISLVFAIINTSGHIKQVAAIIAAYILNGNYEYVNITNILYCILGAVYMFVPINILVQPKTMIAKTRMIKYTYFFMGLSYLLGNIWIIKWIFSLLTGIDVNIDISSYQFEQGYMFTHLAWGTRNEFGAFMNIYIGVLYIILGFIVNRKIEYVYKLMLLISVSGFLLPVAVFMLSQPISEMFWWITKSLPLMFANLAMTVLYAYSQAVPGRWEENICLIDVIERKKAKNYNSVQKSKDENKNPDDVKSDEMVKSDRESKSTERHHRHHSHRSSNGSSHRTDSHHGDSSTASEHERYENANTWKPVDMVHGNDKRVVKYDHKIYDTPESRVGVKNSDIVKLDSEKRINPTKVEETTTMRNDNSDEGDIIWISKNK